MTSAIVRHLSLFPLSAHLSDYITVVRLLRPKHTLTPEVDILRREALDILSLEQERLCETLVDLWLATRHIRNREAHPRPDIATAYHRLTSSGLGEEGIDTITEFLSSDPMRIPSREERYQPNPDLRLFAADGEYKNVAEQWVELLQLQEEKSEFERLLAAHTKAADDPMW
jgi:hypothetical protein